MRGCTKNAVLPEGEAEILLECNLKRSGVLHVFQGSRTLHDADQILTMYIVVSKRHYFANKGPSSQDYGFPSSHV